MAIHEHELLVWFVKSLIAESCEMSKTSARHPKPTLRVRAHLKDLPANRLLPSSYSRSRRLPPPVRFWPHCKFDNVAYHKTMSLVWLLAKA